VGLGELYTRRGPVWPELPWQATALGMPRPQPHYYTRTFETPSNRPRPLKNAAAPAALGLVAREEMRRRTTIELPLEVDVGEGVAVGAADPGGFLLL
jgi:hypothetical protein